MHICSSNASDQARAALPSVPITLTGSVPAASTSSKKDSASSRLSNGLDVESTLLEVLAAGTLPVSVMDTEDNAAQVWSLLPQLCVLETAVVRMAVTQWH